MIESLLRIGDVERRVGFSAAEIYRQISAGNFPAPIKFGKRAVRWPESEINNWIERKITAARGATQSEC